ncbi:MAG: transcriptional repressor LexA [Frateuria sp.]|uniref:transcriptional repressor LexA n=1 Tax=Frateuria sp. TaxID=2211372 RepID=UPI00180190C1|nr:transcriptional repressor LexA [Frateuria sp.]NUO73076.1 transcriptional repressor LexA [Frateuria sp.]NUR21839.1 transcriptional repressor LexA [Frateuria sp.]
MTPIRQALLDYLREHIAAHGYPPSQLQIAAALGLKQNRSARLHLEALAREGHVELVPGQARGIRLRRPPAVETLQVPLLGRVAAGRPIGSDAQVQREVALDASLFRLRPDYLLEVVGESMLLDGILPGDLIGVHRTPEARHGQTVVARLEGEFTVKRLERKAGRVRLLPRNPAHAPIEVDPRATDFAIEGLFAGLVRPG